MDMNPTPYWANLFLYFLESKYVQQLISEGSPRAYKFPGTSNFIADLCILNDDGVFSSSYKYIYLKQFELKLEHQGENATFLDI